MRKIFLLTLTILVVGCGPDAALKRAKKLESKNQAYKAWRAYQDFAVKYPKHENAPQALFRAGWLAQRRLNDCVMASAFYERVVQNYPQSEPWALWAGYQKNNCPDYFPLLAGGRWIEGDSDSGGKNARIETISKPDPDAGRVPWAGGIFARSYFAGASNFKTVELKYRKAGEEVQELTGGADPRPKVILKIPPAVGTKWKTKSGTQLYAYEIVADDRTVKVEAGEFKNCVVVRSSIEGSPGAALEYYAPAVGRVMTAFVTPTGERRNTELLSFSPAADVGLDEEPKK